MTVSMEARGPGHLIDRPALRAELDKALDKRLTLVVAQAGAGKSTLLRQWSAGHPEYAYVFLEIESADDQATHFFRRLLMDLAVLKPGPADAWASVGERQADPPAPVMSLLDNAFEDLENVVIVVDDAHRLSNVHLMAQLATLVSRTSKNLHLIVSSRSDPPIALSQFRLADELLEIRQAGLAFTIEEAAQLLELMVGRPLSPSHVVALRERTEGWAAGLQLAGLNLRQQQDTDAFIAEFGGNDRLVADYLGEEVLAGLPGSRRGLLLQMSALDDMNADLVHAVTGCHESQGLLGQLQRDSMFMVQLDNRREWFRFHHLFRELLRSRLHAEDPGGEKRILGQAAEWHLDRGSAKSAVEYLLRAQLWDRALDAIVSNIVDVVAHGDMLTVVRWMQQIPPSVRSQRANHRFQAVPRHTGVHGGDKRGMQAAELGPFAAQMLFSSNAQISAAAIWRHLDGLDAAAPPGPSGRITAAAAASETLRVQQMLVAGGRACFLAGETGRARELLRRSLAGPANSAEHVSGLSSLSLVEAWCGNLRRAEALIGEALLAADEASMLSDPALTDAYLASVLTALKRTEAQPPSGRVMLQDLDSNRRVPLGNHDVLFDQALAFLSLGDAAAAQGIVGNWEQPGVDPELLPVVQHHILRACIALYEEATDEATRQLTEAVRVAEIHGHVHVFVRAGPGILALLRDVSGPQSAFRDIILARSQQLADHRRRGGPVEPLTDRELEILSYLPTRFSNVELAERCFVSINTIKTHMVHIYRKLDATDRDTAISRARVLGLL